MGSSSSETASSCSESRARGTRIRTSAAGARPQGVHVYVDDVDAHFEQAKAAGAKINMEPTDQPYGDRRYDCEDPEGHDWFFAQSLS